MPLGADSKTHSSGRCEVMAIEVASYGRWVSSLARMSNKSERRAAREAVAAYYEARLAELIQRVGDAVDLLSRRRTRCL